VRPIAAKSPHVGVGRVVASAPAQPLIGGITASYVIPVRIAMPRT
jgi:hypothetical protein